MPLRLHEAAHHTEAGEQIFTGVGGGRRIEAGLRGKRRDDGMVGTLAGSQHIGVPGLEAEIMAAVLQGKTQPGRDDPGAEIPYTGY